MGLGFGSGSFSTVLYSRGVSILFDFIFLKNEKCSDIIKGNTLIGYSAYYYYYFVSNFHRFICLRIYLAVLKFFVFGDNKYLSL